MDFFKYFFSVLRLSSDSLEKYRISRIIGIYAFFPTVRSSVRVHNILLSVFRWRQKCLRPRMGFIYYHGAKQTFSLGSRCTVFQKKKKNILRIPILFVYYSTRKRSIHPSNERTRTETVDKTVDLTGSFRFSYV